jgi:DNA-binding transcriptional ArsR family regulator
MSLPELYSALADPTRLRVLEMLHEKSRPVHELSAAFDISRPAISRHLRVLKEAGLVKEIKQGRENVYSFQRSALTAGAGWIAAHGAGPSAKPKAEKKPVAARRAPNAAAAPPKAKPVMPPPAAAPQLSFFDI